MTHLIFIPIIFAAVIVRIVSNTYELKFLDFITKVIIIVCAILFIYFFLDYKGFNILLFFKKLLRMYFQGLKSSY